MRLRRVVSLREVMSLWEVMRLRRVVSLREVMSLWEVMRLRRVTAAQQPPLTHRVHHLGSADFSFSYLSTFNFQLSTMRLRRVMSLWEVMRLRRVTAAQQPPLTHRVHHLGSADITAPEVPSPILYSPYIMYQTLPRSPASRSSIVSCCRLRL